MKKFPKFWYESNSYYGWVKSVADLKTVLKYQIDPQYGGLKTKDDFLDRSLQQYDGSMNFGTRIEHTGKKTLREFLLENKIEF
jgi:hypothetical protein